MAFVIEFDGKLRAPVTARLVVVALVRVPLIMLLLVAKKLVVVIDWAIMLAGLSVVTLSVLAFKEEKKALVEVRFETKALVPAMLVEN